MLNISYIIVLVYIGDGEINASSLPTCICWGATPLIIDIYNRMEQMMEESIKIQITILICLKNKTRMMIYVITLHVFFFVVYKRSMLQDNYLLLFFIFLVFCWRGALGVTVFH